MVQADADHYALLSDCRNRHHHRLLPRRMHLYLSRFIGVSVCIILGCSSKVGRVFVFDVRLSVNFDYRQLGLVKFGRFRNWFVPNLGNLGVLIF